MHARDLELSVVSTLGPSLSLCDIYISVPCPFKTEWEGVLSFEPSTPQRTSYYKFLRGRLGPGDAAISVYTLIILTLFRLILAYPILVVSGFRVYAGEGDCSS